MKHEKTKKEKKKSVNVILVVLAILVIVAGIILLQTRATSFSVEIISGVSEVNQVVEISPNVIAFVGSSSAHNYVEGVAGLFYVQNHSYELFNISHYFDNGSIYAIGYNGSALLIGGARYVPQENTS
ncbi:MAG: hypothetical protein QXZ33_07675, partial [Metallosphaera sp.]